MARRTLVDSCRVAEADVGSKRDVMHRNAHATRRRGHVSSFGVRIPVLSTEKKRRPDSQDATVIVVRQEGFEPPTIGLEVRCSILLSYWRVQL